MTRYIYMPAFYEGYYNFHRNHVDCESITHRGYIYMPSYHNLQEEEE